MRHEGWKKKCDLRDSYQRLDADFYHRQLAAEADLGCVLSRYCFMFTPNKLEKRLWMTDPEFMVWSLIYF